MTLRDATITVAALLFACWVHSGCATHNGTAQEGSESRPVTSEDADLPVEDADLPVEDADPHPFGQAESIVLPEPLTVAAAARIALERSPNLLAARSRITAANEAVSQVRAGYYPSLDLSGGVSRTRQSLQAFNIPGFAGTNRYTTYSASLSADWILFDGLAREARVAGREADVLQSLAAFEDVQRLLIQSVELAYNNALLAQESIRTADADAAFNEALLEETRVKVEAGQAALSERLNFEIRLNTAQSQLVTARGELRLALTVLAELMGLPESIPIDRLRLGPLDREVSETAGPPVEIEEVAYALRHRPDLEALRHAITASKAGLDEAEAANLPTLFARGSYGYQRNANAHFDDNDLTMTGSLNLAWNLFSGFSDAAARRAAGALTDEARRNLAARWLSVISEVRQAVTQVGTAREQLALRRKNYELTLETRDLVHKEYRAGQASLVRLNEAQRDLTEADALFSRARIGLRYSIEHLNAVTARNLVSRR